MFALTGSSLPVAAPDRSGRLRRIAGTLLVFGAATLGIWHEFRTRLPVPPREALQHGHTLLDAKRVLAVAAHPDDLEWYAGGTLARMAREGVEVYAFVASDGDKGPNRTNAPDLPAARRAEQRAAADIVGYRKVFMPGLPDRGVSRGDSLLRELRTVYAEVKPDIVLTFDPDLPSLPYLHADHQGAGRIVLDWWRDLGRGRPALYFWQTRRPDTAVDITDLMDVKERARDAHRSQSSGRGGIMRRSNAAAGQRVGFPYAELFRQQR